MPVAVHGHATVVVNSRRIVVFGGYTSGEYSNACYVFDPQTMAWSEPPQQGEWPEARRDMAFCCVQRRLLIHGGYRSQLLSLEDVDKKDEEGKKGRKVETKQTDAGTKAPSQQPGMETITLEDLWTADVGSRGVTWHRLPSRKYAKYGHSAVAWEDRVVFFGGVETPPAKEVAAGTNVVRCVNTIHVLANVGSAAWLDVENEGPKAAIPRARAFHSATVVDQYMIIYGGYDVNEQLLQDVCTLHLPSMTWTKPQLTSPLTEVPHARAFHGAALRGFNEIFIFGGATEDMYTKGGDDVYSLTVSPPPAQIPQEIFQDMLSSLLERVQRTVDALSGDYQKETSSLHGRVQLAEECLRNAELTNHGLNEQMSHLREQRDRFEERINKQ
jgi:N-acetylneuraminic acid mutarotase